jgi:hypothetical protein
MKETVYLVGQISSKEPESYLWRQRVTRELVGLVNIIDPCMTEFNESIKGSGIDPQKYIALTDGIDIIVPKDRLAVAKSTICVANMTQYDKTKPLIGSCFELAWYYDSPEKTVIGIYNGDKDNLLYRHPFIQASVNTWVTDEFEAAELIRDYFCYAENKYDKRKTA